MQPEDEIPGAVRRIAKHCFYAGWVSARLQLGEKDPKLEIAEGFFEAFERALLEDMDRGEGLPF